MSPLIDIPKRAFARAALAVPRVLNAELLDDSRLYLAEYLALQHLAEAPDQAMRMNKLAAELAVSPSGLTRLIEHAVREGLVERRQSPGDARGLLAVLTDAGLRRLEQARPHLLASVRHNILDHLTGLDLAAFARAVGNFAGNADADPRPRQPARRYTR